MKMLFAFAFGAIVATLFLTEKKDPRIGAADKGPLLRLVPSPTENSEPEKPTLH